jgi:hypothetical protein
MTRLADTFPTLRDLSIGVAISALAACAFAQEPPASPDTTVTEESTAADTDASYTTESEGQVTPDSSLITKDPSSDEAGDVEIYDDSLSDEALTAPDPFADDMSNDMDLEGEADLETDEDALWPSDSDDEMDAEMGDEPEG